jgi:hypothetical protein
VRIGEIPWRVAQSALHQLGFQDPQHVWQLPWDPVAESLQGIGQQRLGRVNAEHRSSGTDQLNREVHYPAADIQDLPRCSAGSKQSETQRRNGEMGGVRAVLLRNPSRPACF